MTGLTNQTKSLKISKDKLLGFRHLSLDGNADFDEQAKELFNKRGAETDAIHRTAKLSKDKLLGFRHLTLADDGCTDEQAKELFNKRGGEAGRRSLDEQAKELFNKRGVEG